MASEELISSGRLNCFASEKDWKRKFSADSSSEATFRWKEFSANHFLGAHFPRRTLANGISLNTQRLQEWTECLLKGREPSGAREG